MYASEVFAYSDAVMAGLLLYDMHVRLKVDGFAIDDLNIVSVTRFVTFPIYIVLL